MKSNIAKVIIYLGFFAILAWGLYLNRPINAESEWTTLAGVEGRDCENQCEANCRESRPEEGVDRERCIHICEVGHSDIAAKTHCSEYRDIKTKEPCEEFPIKILCGDKAYDRNKDLKK